MKARPLDDLTPETITARDLAADSNLTVIVSCDGCRTGWGFNVWKIAIRLADTPLQWLRFRCAKCGLYPKSLEIDRRVGGITEAVMTVPLKPVACDEEHDQNQRRAQERTKARWSGR